MKIATLTAAAAAAAAALLSTPALAQDAGYFQVNLGGVASGELESDLDLGGDTFSGESDLESGFFASVVAGVPTGGGFAVEAEIVYIDADIDSADADAAFGYPLNASTSTTGALVNFVYNVGGMGTISPYIGAGIGYGESSNELGGDSYDDKGALLQVKAGVVVPVGGTTFDIGYRYLHLPRFDLSGAGDSVDSSGGAHILSVGARFAF